MERSRKYPIGHIYSSDEIIMFKVLKTLYPNHKYLTKDKNGKNQLWIKRPEKKSGKYYSRGEKPIVFCEEFLHYMTYENMSHPISLRSAISKYIKEYLGGKIIYRKR